MRNGLIGLVSAMVLASTMATVGCGSNSSGAGGSGAGGSSGSGGSSGTGGSSSSGGSSGAGGSSSSAGGSGAGGSSSSGGSSGSGGSSSSGGSSGSGGSSSSGGSPGSGGSSSSGGSPGTGGSPGSGGSSGTGGSSGSGSSVTTLGDTKALGALTAAEATQLCKDVYAYFGKNISMATACKYRGLSDATSSSPSTDAQMQQVCKDHENACTQAGTGVGSADKPGCGDIPATCTATVAQYSACISDEVAVFNQGVSGLPSCATALTANMSAV